MAQAGLSRAALARQIGVERAAITQLLRADRDRLPRAETICALARALQLSSDWLLGLANAHHHQGHILDSGVDFAEEDPSDPAEQLLNWHREALGQQVRYLPADLPDLMLIDPVTDHIQRRRAATRRAGAA